MIASGHPTTAFRQSYVRNLRRPRIHLNQMRLTGIAFQNEIEADQPRKLEPRLTQIRTGRRPAARPRTRLEPAGGFERSVSC